MFIHTFAFNRWIEKGEPTEVMIPRQGLVLDPRPNQQYGYRWLFCIDCHDNDITVTLTGIDDVKKEVVHY